MKKLIAAFTLSFAAGTATADGFAPWNDRAAVNDTPSTTVAETAPAGFAPWRDRDVRGLATGTQAPGLRMTDGSTSAFRPWS